MAGLILQLIFVSAVLSSGVRAPADRGAGASALTEAGRAAVQIVYDKGAAAQAGIVQARPGLALTPARRTTSAPPVPDAGLPLEDPPAARLRIPSLDVDQAIITIPIRDGLWDLGPLGLDVGHLAATGAHPGDDLAMVLVGHMTLSAAQRGPFAYLQKIAKGAEVIYESAGVEYVYEVRAKGRLRPDDVGRLFLPDGQSLFLLTCTDWDSDQRLYASRLLVQAVLTERRSSIAASRLDSAEVRSFQRGPR